ncbi:MAG: hypothetical protein Q8O28_01725 [Smithellaceae bacterium]|nr:hypothetical protein [Smithellaceae bacterium]
MQERSAYPVCSQTTQRGREITRVRVIIFRIDETLRGIILSGIEMFAGVKKY